MKKVNLTLIHNRRCCEDPKKETAVELEFYFDRKRRYIATNVKVCKSEWSDKSKCVIRRKDAQVLNDLLSTWKEKGLSVINKMMTDNIMDISVIPRLIKDENGKGMLFADYCDKRKDKRNVCKATRSRYAVFINFLRRWGKIKYFSDCNVANIRELDELLHRQGKAQSTIYCYHKYLKLFINDAIVDGYLDANPYKFLRMKISRGEKMYVDCISEEQFNSIKNLDLKSFHILRARDLFLFQCYTGLAYSDLMSFKYKNCEETEDGKMFYHAKRKKTDTDFVFQILSPAIDILKKYNYVLPKMTNQKYNDFLKVVGNMAGIPSLHSHMGRATAATLFLSKGMPINIVARVLGHTSLKQTTRYARTLNKDVKGAFDDLEGKM